MLGLYRQICNCKCHCRNARASGLCFYKPEWSSTGRHLPFLVIQSQHIAYLPCMLLLRAVKQSDRKLKAFPHNSKVIFIGLLSSHHCKHHVSKAIDYCKVKWRMMLGVCAWIALQVLGCKYSSVLQSCHLKPFRGVHVRPVMPLIMKEREVQEM